MTSFIIGREEGKRVKERGVTKELTMEGISIFTARPLRVTVRDGVIARVEDTDVKPGLPYLSPGFIDLQVNGYRGVDYSSPSLGAADVDRLIRDIAESGTTVHLATIITGPTTTIIRNLSLLEKARQRSAAVAAAIPGYHIEGPFISSEDGPRGAHSPSQIRRADFEEYRRWQEAAGGRIRIVTVAPEVEDALGFIERVSSDGVLVSIGHTGASPEQIRDAVRAGAKLSTHLGNGSHAVLPRLSNYVWEQLGADELSAGIITDGFHLPRAVVKTVARAKGHCRLLLVSDVAVHGGAKPGVYPWGDIMVEVFPDGHLGLHGTGFLAGAGHLLDRDVAQFCRFTSAGIAEAVELCTVNPARLLGLPDPRSFCCPGTVVDLTLFDFSPGCERLAIRRTIQAGRPVFG